jgi:hypothetical protein
MIIRTGRTNVRVNRFAFKVGLGFRKIGLSGVYNTAAKAFGWAAKKVNPKYNLAGVRTALAMHTRTSRVSQYGIASIVSKVGKKKQGEMAEEIFLMIRRYEGQQPEEITETLPRPIKQSTDQDKLGI